jgi:hypothetical protein
MRAPFRRLASLASLTVILAFAFLVQSAAAPAATTTEVTPNAVNMMDCNGLSPIYQSLKVTMKALCTDAFFNEALGRSASTTTVNTSVTTSQA